MRTRVGLLWLFPMALASACGPLELSAAPDAGAVTKPPFDAAGVIAEFDNSPSEAGAKRAPSVQILAPAPGSRVAARVRIEGSASDDLGVAAVAVRIGPNQPQLADSSDGFRTWSLEADAPLGDFEVVATARDVDGNAGEPARLMLSRDGAPEDSAPPSLTITAPADGSTPQHLLALIEGTASDDVGVVAISVQRNGTLLSEREVETSDFFAHWSRLTPLLAGERNTLVFTARDASGKQTSITLELEGRAMSDHTPPTLELTSPQEDAQIVAETLEISGHARDDSSIREVKVRIGRTPPGASTVAYGDYQVAQTSDGYETFSATLPVPAGEFVVDVLAIDLNGVSTRVTRKVQNGFVPEWSDEVELPLRLIAPSDPTPLNFALDKSGIDEVFTESIQRDIRVLSLDTTGLLTDSVDRIKTSCGTRWQENNENPRHDCSAAGYGQDRNPPIPWQQTPEYSMVRLLTMTPANVVVTGTSLENLQGLADLLGIGGGFHSILADSLGIAPTREIVSTASVVRALQTFWMQAHPEVLPGAKLGITLYDSMHELMPLAERFGPSGSHPGLLDPAFPPRSQLLSDNFEMRLVATSNLRWLDGVDVGGTGGGPRKDYIALVFDQTGPSYDDVLEFDFTDPARFDVVGLVDAPKADLRMLLQENTAFIRTCTANNATCRGNLPNSPASGYVWALPRWQIEPTVAGAAYYEYQTRQNFSKT